MPCAGYLGHLLAELDVLCFIERLSCQNTREERTITLVSESIAVLSTSMKGRSSWRFVSSSFRLRLPPHEEKAQSCGEESDFHHEHPVFCTAVQKSQHKVVILPDYRAAIISRMSYNNIMEVTNMELVRKQTYITPAQDRAVKRLAQQQGITEAEILRKALDLLLAREGIKENEDPLADLIGLFSGPPKVDHDDIYR